MIGGTIPVKNGVNIHTIFTLTFLGVEIAKFRARLAILKELIQNFQGLEYLRFKTQKKSI
ncbi:hypothetical protein PCC7424_4126 [Gloeothece citriformis PCC 7424]|uniref:Uncharacterized protein n=1 Tax=Gloeothece citriformis (strain PCC 7424) TaxID=65393 RepID=B7KLC5_GLOC7|nr:hypothetical protein PCC7424_4126 [Gloeothece citriformis PCC 7424]